jgi:hypothetical protein
MKNTNIKKWVAAMACACLVGTNSYALTINDPGVVGTIETGEPASIADEVIYVNTLLAQPANNGGVTIAGHVYTTSSTDYNGVVTAIDAVKDDTGNLSVPAGYDWVLAKYDGPDAGDVLWFLGGAAMTLPSDSSTIWVNNQENGYGLSHFTVFNPTDNDDTPGVPDGGSTLALLGLALAGVGFLRRRISRS